MGRCLPDSFTAEVPKRAYMSMCRNRGRRRFGSKLEDFVRRSRQLTGFGSMSKVIDVCSDFTRGNATCVVVRCLSNHALGSVLGRGKGVPCRRTVKCTLPILCTLRSMRGTKVVRESVRPSGVFVAGSNGIGLLSFNTTECTAALRSGDLSIVLGPKCTPRRRCEAENGRNP